MPATLPDGATRADLARGQRAYGRAQAADDGGARAAVLLPRYGFTRFALPAGALLLAAVPETTEDDTPPGRAEGRAVYSQAARRGRIDIPSGDLVDLTV